MLKDFADYIVYSLIGLTPEAHLGKALNFFIYDSIKILILLSVIIFLVATGFYNRAQALRKRKTISFVDVKPRAQR